MELSFSKEDLKFRDEVRAFIAEKYDEDLRRKMAFSKNGYLDKEGQVKWQKALYERGWAAVNWPKEYGGAGFTANQKYIFDLEMSAAGTPIVSPMSGNVPFPCANVIVNWYSVTQERNVVPSWCCSLRYETFGDEYGMPLRTKPAAVSAATASSITARAAASPTSSLGESGNEFGIRSR